MQEQVRQRQREAESKRERARARARERANSVCMRVRVPFAKAYSALARILPAFSCGDISINYFSNKADFGKESVRGQKRELIGGNFSPRGLYCLLCGNKSRQDYALHVSISLDI